MKAYQSKFKKLSGTDHGEIHSKALNVFKQIKSRTKRKPYIHSVYFGKKKVFLDYFWQHLQQKNWRDRNRRLKYYPCAIDLIRNSRLEPTSKQNPNKPKEILHRFAGLTKDKEIFYIQIKEDKKTNKKYFMSVFPPE